MAIDGPSMAHRWASMGPSMGLNGVSVRGCFHVVMLLMCVQQPQLFSRRLNDFPTLYICRPSADIF